MAETSSERGALKPIEAYPELPIIPGDPPPLERISRHLQDHHKTRRAVVGAGALAAATAIAAPFRRFLPSSENVSSTENDATTPHEYYENVSRMPDGDLKVGVAQYLTPNQITFVAQKGNETLQKYEEPTIHVRAGANSNAEDFPTNPDALNNLDIGLRRVLSSHSNQYFIDNSQLIKSGDNYRYLWYELGRLDEDGNWITVDTNGKPTDTPLYVSPTGLDINSNLNND